jgi:hypothetical protein
MEAFFNLSVSVWTLMAKCRCRVAGQGMPARQIAQLLTLVVDSSSCDFLIQPSQSIFLGPPTTERSAGRCACLHVEQLVQGEVHDRARPER